jgi:hypothetical protein
MCKYEGNGSVVAMKVIPVVPFRQMSLMKMSVVDANQYIENDQKISNSILLSRVTDSNNKDS